MPYGIVISPAERELVRLVWPTPEDGLPVTVGRLTSFDPNKGRQILADLAAYELVDPDDQVTRTRFVTRVADLCGTRLLDNLPVDPQIDMFDNTQVNTEDGNKPD